MKNYNNYILEKNSRADLEIREFLLENCMPFINKMRKDVVPFLFYRGIPDYINDIEDFINDRTTYKDSGRRLHDLMNKYGEEKFGWKIRNGVFATNNLVEANRFTLNQYDDDEGSINICIPIGEFNFVYSQEVVDLTEKVADDFMWVYISWMYKNHPKILPNNDPLSEFNSYKDEYDKDYDEYIQNLVKTYKDKNLGGADNVEVSFDCKEYYLINPKHEHIVLRLFDHID